MRAGITQPPALPLPRFGRAFFLERRALISVVSSVVPSPDGDEVYSAAAHPTSVCPRKPKSMPSLVVPPARNYLLRQ
jgi:hypothetical protein